VYLSELTIVGFKSFAKKTNLLFHDGITGIVGPNGCGKSNIVDSILWVMGEQRTGALRSDRMENVIFNGSATAKPVGMAEVSLKIENTKNILPIDYSEVVITRRLFRSGESQYLINGNTCRLKDILDLFLDTGAGPHTYSVIELAQVERILNGKEDERRKIFEEAAGITKYKLRRKATFRKLESTEKDLIRIEDIMSEVEKNVRTLKRQVTKAQRYQELAEELKALEIALADHDYNRLTLELEPLETHLDLARGERESSSSTLAMRDADYEAARAKLLDLERALAEKQRLLNEQLRESQKFEERILVNQERVRSLEESNLRYIQERESLQLKLQALQEQQQVINERTAVSERILNDHLAEQVQVNQDYEAIRRDYEEKRIRFREIESQVLIITEELSRKQNEGERLKATEENLSRRIAQITEEEKATSERLQEVTALLQSTRTREVGLTQSLEEKKKKTAELMRSEDEMKRSFEQMQKQEGQDRNRVEVLTHQAELIKRLIDTYEDYPSGVRFLATNKEIGFSSYGPLANIIQVQPNYRSAISASLGEAATYLVVEDASAAFNGIGLLKEERRGVVTFAPRNEIKWRVNHRPAVSDLGVIGYADELVSHDESFQDLIYAVLGHFLVVQDLQTANRIYNQVKSHQVNVVTLAGEVLGHSGFIRGGTNHRNQSDFVGRQEQLQALVAEIDKLKQGIDLRHTQMAQKELDIQRTKIDIEAQSAEIKKMEEELANLKVELGKMTFEEASLQETHHKQLTERQHLLGEVSQLGQNLELQAMGADDLTSRRQQLGQTANQLSEEIKNQEQNVADVSGRLQEINVLVAKWQSDHESLRREMESIAGQIRETSDLIRMRTEETDRARKEILELHKVNEEYHQRIEELKGKREALQAELTSLEEQQYQTNTLVAEQEKAIRYERGKLDELAESVHKIELRVSELKLRLENLKSRMREEFEYTLQRGPVDETFNAEEIGKRIEEMREKIKEVGPVNLLSLKEYEQEKERMEFLQVQRDDLIKARKNLTETIDIINATARQKFMKTFEQVQQNFSQVFGKFFEGGRASLALQETADPLEAEIEIFATPGGKKMSAITLLSGGEKSLTAISLLFAIYLYKPSPFCIFDEVDAPLDDRNVRRFTNALQEFSKNTQFLVVTHNKMTMRAADQLYGITMEEKGVSKVVSVKFDSNQNGNAAG